MFETQKSGQIHINKCEHSYCCYVHLAETPCPRAYVYIENILIHNLLSEKLSTTRIDLSAVFIVGGLAPLRLHEKFNLKMVQVRS